jgi:acetate kinase
MDLDDDVSPRAPLTILTVNAGSSSIRLGLFEATAAGLRRIRVVREDAGAGGLARLDELSAGAAAIDVVVHRVVHGGPRLRATCPLDGAVGAEIARMTPLAPLHNPATLAWVDACRQRLPGAAALAVFDTGFFADLPAVAATYALPLDLRERWGISRLGFHGVAHRSMWEAWRALAPGGGERVISFQLGSGCSVAALRGGRPIDTSMGFTPLEGLVMATRSGDVDPGALLYLLREGGLTAEGLADVLTTRSGLAGLAGGRDDVRALLEAKTPEAELAVDVYCYRARKYLGAYFAALGGCDAVLVGGGVGEHQPEIRRRMLAGLGALGIELDPAQATAAAPARLSSTKSRVAVWIVPTDEETILAREAQAWAQRAPA